jgi:hypothetical protein
LYQRDVQRSLCLSLLKPKIKNDFHYFQRKDKFTIENQLTKVRKKCFFEKIKITKNLQKYGLFEKCENSYTDYCRVGVNCSKFDCSTINWSTLLAGNQLLDTKFINCSNPVNPGSTGFEQLCRPVFSSKRISSS